MQKKLLIILGPTGTGKTDLAIQLLQKIPGEIISADSRQVFQGLDYATNKLSSGGSLKSQKIAKFPGYWIQDSVRVNLYDVLSQDEKFSAGQFFRLASKHLDRIWKKLELPIVVGGTGFYIDALLGRIPVGSRPQNLMLRRQLNKLDLPGVQGELEKADPEAYQSLSASDLSNKRRLVRLIELATEHESASRARQYSRLKEELERGCVNLKEIGLVADRQVLYQRTDHWVDQLLEQDCFFDEVKSLLKFRSSQGDELLGGIIFSPAVEYLNGQINKSELKKKVKGQLHRYIRSQLTWFKKSQAIEWVNIAKEGWREYVTSEVVKWYDELD